MWFIGDKRRPHLGAVSGPEGWKTKEDCEKTIIETKKELEQLGRKRLRDAVELFHGNTESQYVQYEAGELERQLRQVGNFVPIEVI